MKKQAPSKAQPVIDVQPDNPELALATTEGSSLTTFVGGLRQFFGRAKELEQLAGQTLARARQWERPTSKAEDERLVTAVRGVADQLRAVEEHWQITALISRFHRRLTTERSRTTEALETAKRIGEQLHADYAAAEQRRAREEEERDRRARQEQQEREREAELLRLDEQAAAAEAASADLSDRESRFVDYLTGPYSQSAERAAHHAGYRNADKAAVRLLNTPKIVAALEGARQAKALRDQAAARRAAPVEVTSRQVKPEVAKGGTMRWSAEVCDAEAFMAAVLDPKSRTQYGIPADVATFVQTRLNQLAVDLHEQIDRWPGVRHRKTPGIR